LITYGDLSLEFVKDDSDKQELRRIRNKGILKFLSERNIYWTDMPNSVDFIAKSSGETIGGASLYNIRWFNKNAYISIFVDVDKQGRGYGSKILKSILKFAFETMNLERVTAEIYEYNEASIKLFESLGFVKEGRLRKAKYMDGKYWDIIIYGLLRDEYLDGKKY